MARSQSPHSTGRSKADEARIAKPRGRVAIKQPFAIGGKEGRKGDARRRERGKVKIQDSRVPETAKPESEAAAMGWKP